METSIIKNLNKQILDIQNLRLKISDPKLIKIYRNESDKQRMLLNKFIENVKNYEGYINLSKNDLEKIKYSYFLLDQMKTNFFVKTTFLLVS